MLITFTVSIEVEECITLKESQVQAKDFDQILSDMEELVAKKNYDLDDSRWDAY
jgi:hypothetical protein